MPILCPGAPTPCEILTIRTRDQIISVAKENEVDAVIPGYGFLSENPEFARRLSDNGICFIGPSADVIESLGLKHTARQYAIDTALPVVPGSPGLVVHEEEAVDIVRKIGFPVSGICFIAPRARRVREFKKSSPLTNL